MENNLAEITVAYESGWNKYTEKFYSRTEWPEAEVIAPLVNDGTFVRFTRRPLDLKTLKILSSLSSTGNYTTAMSTHVSNPTSTIVSIHMKTAANSSITSSVGVATVLLTSPTYVSEDSEGPVQLELPEQWLWDIIDEFIYQYQVFCTWRSKVKSKTDDEILMLADGGPVSPELSTSSYFHPDIAP